MKTVYFVRHAKSSWSDANLRDIERPLNKRGRRDAPFMAKLLKGRGVRPDRLISSPAKRAYLTASFFANALGTGPENIDQHSKIYEAYPGTILKIIEELPDEWNTVLLFGHNPTFTDLANTFSSQYISNVPTCGICRVDCEVEEWGKFTKENAELTEFHYPKQYF